MACLVETSGTRSKIHETMVLHQAGQWRVALMREPRQPICIAISERVPSRSFGELQVADVGSESQADP
jgi:hypothetical protein